VKVTINGADRELAEGTKIADVADDVAGGRRTGVAIAVNGEIVPKSRWPYVAVGEGDRLEVLSAIGGG
jgi:sulfur carrier protein